MLSSCWARVNVAPIDLIAMFLLYAEYMYSSNVANLWLPYKARTNFSPVTDTSTGLLSFTVEHLHFVARYVIIGHKVTEMSIFLPCLYSADGMSQPVMEWRKSKFCFLSPTAWCIALIFNTFAGLEFILGWSRNSFASGGVLATNMTKRNASVPTNTTASSLPASSMPVDKICQHQL